MISFKTPEKLSGNHPLKATEKIADPDAATEAQAAASETPGATVEAANEELAEVASEQQAEASELTAEEAADAIGRGENATLTRSTEATQTGLAVADVPALSAETLWEEIELFGALGDAERDVREKESLVDTLKSELKDAKEDCKLAVLALRRAASKIADFTAGNSMPERPAIEDKTESEADASGFDEDAWRAFPTADLVKGIKGLGKGKKYEALIDFAPTVGELEDARGLASKQHKSFKDVLPDGFGQTIADALEDRLIEHVAKHSVPPASEQVKQNDEPAEEAAEEHPHEHASVDWVLDEMIDAARRRVKSAKTEGSPKEVFSPSEGLSENDPFAMGFAAYENGEQYLAMPKTGLTPDGSERWLQGWASAELVANWDKPEEAEESSILDDDSDLYDDVD